MRELSSATISPLRNSIHPPEGEINPSKRASDLPIRWRDKQKKKKKKKRNTRNPPTLAYSWNALVNVQLHILDDPHSVHLKNATTRTTTYNRVENTTEAVVCNEDTCHAYIQCLLCSQPRSECVVMPGDGATWNRSSRQATQSTSMCPAGEHVTVSRPAVCSGSAAIVPW